MALCESGKTDIKLEAVSVKWGREECRKVTFVDDVAGSLTDEYFDLNMLDEDQVETQYYVLLSGTTPATDPTPAGKTKIDVTYTDGDTANAIAVLFETALSALNVNVEVVLGVAEVQNKWIGAVTAEVNTNAPSLTFEVNSVGIGGTLGATASGGSSLTVETQSAELKSDQTGELILGEIFTGSSASIDMGLLEMTKTRWETIMGSVTGDIFTPSAGGSTRLVGQGTSRLYSNLFDLGGKLILHPIRLAASDKTEDIVFWRSAPKPSSVNFSGTDQQQLDVSFVAYNDTTKPDAVSLWCQGDYTQELV
jgi:hypothetical protein